jgi:hypothetical protein
VPSAARQCSVFHEIASQQYHTTPVGRLHIVYALLTAFSSTQLGFAMTLSERSSYDTDMLIDSVKTLVFESLTLHCFAYKHVYNSTVSQRPFNSKLHFVLRFW